MMTTDGLATLEEDQRIYDRFSAQYPAKFKDTREDFGDTVYLKNASAEGAQIISKERLYIHDTVALEVKLPDGYAPMPLRGEVIWVKQTEPNYWEYGIKFHKVEFMRLSRLYKFVADLLPVS